MRRPRLSALLLPVSLLACSHGAHAELRLQLVLAAEWPDPVRFAARAEQVAGVPVSAVAAVSPRVYALTLACADPPACEAARARLAAESSFAERVLDDPRHGLPPRPAASTAR
jgi:hypothetical protein